MTLGEKIVELRKKHGLTGEKLSEKLNISRQTLSNWENNTTTPDILGAKSIASFFQISLDDLTDNHVEIRCKKNTNELLNDLVGKTCFILFDDEFVDVTINHNTKFKVLEVSDSFIKVEYELKKELIIKLIDIDIVLSIKEILEEYK